MKIPFNWLKDYIDTKLDAKEVASRLTMVGHALDKPIFNSGNDVVMDLEDRGNRSDMTGIVGIARDLAAILGTKLKLPKASEIPPSDNTKFQPPITEKSDKVLRWTAVVFKDIKVEKSPKWLAERLTSYGVDPINNVVDITNFVMVELGMPLHAFDLDNIREIVLRNAKKGESLITFEGSTLNLDENDLVATDNNHPLTLTTAVGGQESGITEKTTSVLIEAGLYDQPTARRSAIKHNVRNETSLRLGKYLHPHFCEIAIARTIYLMKEILGVEPESVSFDYYPNKSQEVVLELSQTRLDKISGDHIPLITARNILESLDFLILGLDEIKLTVTVPYFRTDVLMEDDLIEEVLRIRGYDKIPSHLPMSAAPKKLSFPYMDIEDRLKDILVKLEFYEAVGLQITDTKILLNLGLNKPETSWPWKGKEVVIENSWNAELNTMRTTMFVSLAKYMSSYQKHRLSDVKLFETGKTFRLIGSGDDYKNYIEDRKVGLIMDSNYEGLKPLVGRLLKELGIPNVTYKKTELEIFKRGMCAYIKGGDEIIGVIGEVRHKILEQTSPGGVVAYCELDTKLMQKYSVKEYKPRTSTFIKNYIIEDISFEMKEVDEVDSLIRKLSAIPDLTTLISFKNAYQDYELKKKRIKKVALNLKYPVDRYEEESDKIRRLLKELT